MISSIVFPAYNEAESLGDVYASVTAVLDPLNFPWGIVIADDGSRDDTWKRIVELHDADERVKGVQLAGISGISMRCSPGSRMLVATRSSRWTRIYSTLPS